MAVIMRIASGSAILYEFLPYATVSGASRNPTSQPLVSERNLERLIISGIHWWIFKIAGTIM
jgi:hypothetical protein